VRASGDGRVPHVVLARAAITLRKGAMPASLPRVDGASPPVCAACAARAAAFRRHIASSLTALLAGLELLDEELATAAQDREAARVLLAHCRSAARALAAHLAPETEDGRHAR
jgi:protein tyrosine phosphatase (PTP) superfamily phosphohydrolase (DUF442 family)